MAPALLQSLEARGPRAFRRPSAFTSGGQREDKVECFYDVLGNNCTVNRRKSIMHTVWGAMMARFEPARAVTGDVIRTHWHLEKFTASTSVGIFSSE